MNRLNQSRATYKALVFTALCLTLSGCTTVKFVSQAAIGQFDLMARRRPIKHVLRDDATPKKLKELLAQVSGIKSFGQTHGLSPTDNYETYAAVNRPAAVWSVTACAPLSFESKVWEFPLVGSFPYLGFFDRWEAEAFAAEMKSQGLDVNVRPASAYSTLGWFEDPIISTMIYPSPHTLADLANVILHESVHATIHISNQTHFNEAVATFVGDKLTFEYLASLPHLSPLVLKSYRFNRAVSKHRIARLKQGHDFLSNLYAQDLSDDDKRQQKNAVLRQLELELNLRRPLNNASLSEFKAYQADHDKFEGVYVSCGSWKNFWRVVGAVGENDFSERHQTELEPLLKKLSTQCRQNIR